MDVHSTRCRLPLCRSPRRPSTSVNRGAEVLGSIPKFSDHTLNNAAFVRTSDGILHILGTEVLMPHENSSRVHYMRFDPRSQRWLNNDVLMVRATFTSTS